MLGLMLGARRRKRPGRALFAALGLMLGCSDRPLARRGAISARRKARKWLVKPHHGRLNRKRRALLGLPVMLGWARFMLGWARFMLGCGRKRLFLGFRRKARFYRVRLIGAKLSRFCSAFGNFVFSGGFSREVCRMRYKNVTICKCFMITCFLKGYSRPEKRAPGRLYSIAQSGVTQCLYPTA